MAASKLILLLALFLMLQPSTPTNSSESGQSIKLSDLLDVVEYTKEGIINGTKVVELFDKMIKQAIAWDEFKKMIDELESQRKLYSDEVAHLVGRVRTYIFNSYDSYFSAVQAVYKWSDSAVPSLSSCKEKLSKKMSKDLSETINKRLIKVLSTGHDAATNAVAKLDESGRSFNDVSGNLEKLVVKLDNDNAKGSSFRTIRVLEVRVNRYTQALVFLVACLILPIYFLGPTTGLVDTLKNHYSLILMIIFIYSIISILVVELYFVNGLVNSLSETGKLITNLKPTVTNAQLIISKAKTALHEEIRAQNKIGAKITATDQIRDDWQSVPEAYYKNLKISIESLIHICNQYMKHADDNSKLNHPF